MQRILMERKFIISKSLFIKILGNDNMLKSNNSSSISNISMKIHNLPNDYEYEFYLFYLFGMQKFLFLKKRNVQLNMSEVWLYIYIYLKDVQFQSNVKRGN